MTSQDSPAPQSDAPAERYEDRFAARSTADEREVPMLWHLLIAGMLGLAVGIACSLPPNPGMTLVAAPGLTVGAFALMIWSDIRFGGTIGGPAAEQSAWPTLLPFLLLLAVPFGQFFAPTLTPGGAITAGALVGLAFLAYLRWYQRRQMRTVATSTDEEPSGPFG